MGYAIGSPSGSAIIATYLPAGPIQTRSFAAIAGCTMKRRVALRYRWGDRRRARMGAGRIIRRSDQVCFLSGQRAHLRYGWRIFQVVVSLPLIYPIVVGIFFIPKDLPHPHDKRVDWLGAIFITTSQVLLNLAFALGTSLERGWFTPCR